MPTLFYAGDISPETGLGRISENILVRLAKMGWDITCLGVNYGGEPHDYPFRIFPAASPLAGVRADPMGRNYIGELFASLKPDVVLLHRDLWIVQDWIDALAPHLAAYPCPVVAYFPVEAPGTPIKYLRRLPDCYARVTYSEFGVREMAAAGLRQKVEAIPPGIDFDLFKPMDKAECRRGFGFPEDLFLVLHANVNSARKRPDAAARGFAHFLARDYEKKQNCRIHFHCAINREAGGAYDLDTIFETECLRLGIENPAMHITYSPSTNLPVSEMPALYNCADVMLATPGGEAWGLTTHEGMACGVPQIAPAIGELAVVPCYKSGAEEKYGGSVYRETLKPFFSISDEDEPGDYVDAETGLVFRNPALGSVEGALSMMESHFNREKYAGAGFVHTHGSNRLDWENIALRWHTLLLDAADAGYKARADISRSTREAARSPKPPLESYRIEVSHAGIRNLIVCPSWDSRCGIAQYTRGMVRDLALTAKVRSSVVETVEDAVALAMNPDLQADYILVHHEYGFFDPEAYTDPRTGICHTAHLTRGETTHGFLAALRRLKEKRPEVVVSVLMHTVSESQDSVVQNRALMRAHQDNVIRLFATSTGGASVMGCDVLPLGSWPVLRTYLPERPAPLPGEALIIGNFGLNGAHRDIRGHLDLCAATGSGFLGSFYSGGDARLESRLRAALDACDLPFKALWTDFPEEREIVQRMAKAHVLYMPRNRTGGHFSSASVRLAMHAGRPIIINRNEAYSDLMSVLPVAETPEQAAELVKRLREDPAYYLAAVNRMRDYLTQNPISAGLLREGVVAGE